MRALPAALVALMLLHPVASPAEGYSVAAAVEATYLVKFAPFVEWPAGAFPFPTSPLNLCVLGDDPVTRLVDIAARGERVAGHPIATRHLRSLAGTAQCHILYIAPAETENSPDMLDRLRGAALLTVTAEPGDGRSAGIINFVIRDNRVRFAIDERLAAAGGLTISSKLLSLAVRVRPRA